MNKAVFLDRDGTINIDYGYVYKKEDFVFIDGVIDALKILSDLGYKLVIISNQSGIGRGYYTLHDLYSLNDYMINCLNKYNIKIDGFYFCPHIDSDNCNCRKPQLELFNKAIKDLNIDCNNSFAIGDNERDLSICGAGKVKGILLTNKNNQKYICKNNLLDAVTYIKENNK